MQIRISLYSDTDLSYPRKEVIFYGREEKFYNKLVEYAELLQCKDNEDEKEVKLDERI